jgi:hypothetical protein
MAAGTLGRTSAPAGDRKGRAAIVPGVSRLPRALLVVWIMAFAIAASGCGAILNNDPNLRWWAFKTFGAQRVCPEMLKASVPLRFQEGQPITGRYFPTSCTHSINDQNRSILVNVSGTGYAYMPTVKRIGFNLSVSVEYAFDYRFEDDGVWAWGKLTRVAAGPDFRIVSVENKIADIATILTPAGTAANSVGGQVVTGFLQRGFTVIENDDGSKEFSLGVLPPGRHPLRPIEVDADDEALTFANETTQVAAGQRDFLGPFEVADDDQAIQLKGSLTGNAVELMVYTKAAADGWREAWQQGGGVAPMSMPITSAPIQPGPFSKRFKLRPGVYYVVVDNTASAGQVSPPVGLINIVDPVSTLTYVAQLIEP